MINLIPNEEKKVMIKNFYYRLVIVVLFALGIVMFIASIVLLPSYFISSVKERSFNKSLNAEIAKEIETINQQNLSIVSALDYKLSLLEKSSRGKFILSEKVINEILLKKISNIKITQIYFENNATEGRKINISGTATSRERLSMFSHALENDPLFKKVDLPISNFIKGSNIRFSLSLIPS